jgi:hypothetical protein
MRTAFAEEPGTTILAIGGTPGKAYEPDGWELWMPVAPLFNEGRYAEAADRTRELAEAHPELPMLTYMLACCEQGGAHGGRARGPPRGRRLATDAYDRGEGSRPRRDRHEPAFAQIID